MDLDQLREHLYNLYTTTPNDEDEESEYDDLHVGGALLQPDMTESMIKDWILGGDDTLEFVYNSAPLDVEEFENQDNQEYQEDQEDNIVSEYVEFDDKVGGSTEDVDRAIEELEQIDPTPIPTGPQLSLTIPISAVTRENTDALKNESFKRNIVNLLNNIIL